MADREIMNPRTAGAFTPSIGVDAIDRAMSLLGLSIEQPPRGEQWGEFLSVIAYEYHHSDAARFENLFNASPIPTIEQDYSLVVERFEKLRSEGVTDLRSYIGTDARRLRTLIGDIRNVAANPAAIQIIGLNPREVEGPVDLVIVNEESRGSWVDQLETIWHGKTYSEFEFLGRTALGEPFDARRRMAVPVGPLGPDYRRVVVTIEDATRERDEQRRLEHLVEEKNEFLAAVSHEIRTPLTGVVGFTEILLDNGESMSWAETAGVLASIANQAQEVSDLVEDLLIATRSESGDLAVTREPVDLTAEVSSVLHNGGSHTQGVSIETEDNTSTVLGDPGRIRQIVRNLLTNAERYGGPNVKVTIGARPGWATVTVSDDGDGVAADRLDSLFTSSHMVNAATVSGSTGLGLSICRNLAGLMGGDLTYERVADRTLFRLSLRSGS
jgi:signal transduction histidine kinase